ncbi:MAG: hypothetical protein ACTJGQ_05715 [Agrococcus casei]
MTVAGIGTVSDRIVAGQPVREVPAARRVTWSQPQLPWPPTVLRM